MQNITAFSEFSPEDADEDDIEEYVSQLKETYTAYETEWNEQSPNDYALWVNEGDGFDFPLIRATTGRITFNSRYDSDSGITLSSEFFINIGVGIHEALVFTPETFRVSRLDDFLKENFEQQYERVLARVLVPLCAYDKDLVPELYPLAKLGQAFTEFTVPAVRNYSETSVQDLHPHTGQETLPNQQMRDPLKNNYYENLSDSNDIDISKFASHLTHTYRYELLETEGGSPGVNIWQCAESSYWNYPVIQKGVSEVPYETYSRTDEKQLNQLPREFIDILPSLSDMAAESDGPESFTEEVRSSEVRNDLEALEEPMGDVAVSLSYLLSTEDPPQELAPLNQWVEFHLADN